MKKHLLVVEDEADLVSTIKDSFTEKGFAVTAAADGAEGLEKALAEKPDVILLDLVMPKVGGLEMLQRLREDEWGKDARVIVLTAHDKDDNLIAAGRSGVDAFIIKSNVSIGDLYRQVDNVLK